ncbi:MAG: MBL fold metallo-hydrolase [Chloroflexi bacterium]|nr:MBL fold metallo-hydrolase [Chloroflexota bacterium]
MLDILPGLSTFSGLVVGRVYLIEDQDGVTLVDTGTAAAVPLITRQIKSKDYGPQDIKRILITHGHPDHIGGLPKLKQLTGAQVIAPAIDRPAIEGRVPMPLPPPAVLPGPLRLLSSLSLLMPGTRVDRAVQAGETISEVMGGVQVISTPGHTPGHISYWQPEKRILFCGDIMINTAGLRLPFAIFTVDMAENKRSVQKLAALNPAVLCSGHGPPLRERTAERVRKLAEEVGE